jgi:formylglycine-generating enzyme required for sulfatase activity
MTNMTSTSEMTKTATTGATPDQDMVSIPAGTYVYRVEHRVREGRCPLHDHGPRLVQLPAFLLDRVPVTNAAFGRFVREAAYRPSETRNFLRHWTEAGGDPASGNCPANLADHPVIWVSPDDAAAYAAWAGKRLPRDEEWQWAAQGPDGRVWPWGNAFDPSKCNHDTAGTSPVDAHPQGTSPFGCLDMAGNVYEWIDPVLDDGWHRWCFVRGGSYYLPRGSYWYVDGGAQRNDHHARILLLGEAINRAGTVGFRCAKDL